MASTSSCLYTTVCIHDTGNPMLNDTYVRTGTFNDNSYYIGQTNSYVIFFSSQGYWCVSDYIDGPCLLTGKKPCTSVCPDFCDDYYQRGVCPPPIPDPVNPCEIIDFEAIFNCNAPVPTPSATPECGGKITTSATSPTSIIELAPKTNIVYTNQGTLFHSPFNFDGTSPDNIYLANINTQPVWKNTGSSNGPLNRSGLWTTSPTSEPYDIWLGFTVCINVPETKTYWVGLGGDNNFRISIDGETILNTIGGPYDDSTIAFIYWHVYPITLSSGSHVVEIFGLNNASAGAFGCEIYNNTIAELTGATQVSDLNIIFTSAGQTEATIVQNLSGQYTSSGYTCPTGYVFDPCTISCFTIIPPCTPTATPTPTATIFCPLYVDASIQSYTPTPTVTPSITPSTSAQIARDCGFMGDVTFNTINSTIDCPFSLEFQDCYNGALYYTVDALSRPEGGNLDKFMIYQANVDNVRRCISYVGVNVNIIGNNKISFISNLIGYSNLGQCVGCLGILTPTPTPTPSITPTITLTSSSNIPPAPDPSNTPTPTKTKPVLYYIYQKCNSSTRLCQPVEAIPGQSPMTIFKTGDYGPYKNTCWFLYTTYTTCLDNNPLFNTIIYNTNAFPSILNATYTTCAECNSGTPSINPQSPSNSPTPTNTPTPTRAPQVQACKQHLAKISLNDCAICNNTQPSTTTVYSPSDFFVPGAQVYSNSTCTTPIQAGRFIVSISASNEVDSITFVIGGQGVLSPHSCTTC